MNAFGAARLRASSTSAADHQKEQVFHLAQWPDRSGRLADQGLSLSEMPVNQPASVAAVLVRK